MSYVNVFLIIFNLFFAFFNLFQKDFVWGTISFIAAMVLFYVESNKLKINEKIALLKKVQNFQDNVIKTNSMSFMDLEQIHKEVKDFLKREGFDKELVLIDTFLSIELEAMCRLKNEKN